MTHIQALWRARNACEQQAWAKSYRLLEAADREAPLEPEDRMNHEHVGTAVIGGSQAGLAVGYYLVQRRLPFVILDDNDRIGDAWRNRWDSLRLFTPGRYDGLPGMPFPGSPSSYPTKDEAADYLEAYAREFELPVRTGVKVGELSKAGDRFEVICGEDTLLAENVVVATGAYHTIISVV